MGLSKRREGFLAEAREVPDVRNRGAAGCGVARCGGNHSKCRRREEGFGERRERCFRHYSACHSGDKPRPPMIYRHRPP